MKKIGATRIFLKPGDLRDDAIVILNDEGTILSIEQANNHDPQTIEMHNGLLVPGYINAHCHLELSHMKGRAPTGTGLIPFIKTVVGQRDVAREVVLEALVNADLEMQQNGIVAVGDISNVTDSFACKRSSPIRYYTFVEAFDFLVDQNAERVFEDMLSVYRQAPTDNGNHCSAVPHAPYSVSPTLFRLINELNQSIATVSIHNQETPPETELFTSGSGDFVDFYRQIGIALPDPLPQASSSLAYALEHLDAKHRFLFAHNTLSTREDLELAQKLNQLCFWVSNPNANLYIENRLPDYQLFIDQGAKVCLGTDSLTSNWQLSIFEEMKTIARYQSFVDLEDLVTWATINGAEALGFDDELGTIEIGKRPGLNLITHNPDFQLDQTSTSRKVV